MAKQITVLKWIVWMNVAVSILKFQAYIMTHSAGILTDALESLINIVASVFALFAARWAEQPADKDHHYGHGKMELFSVGFEGGLIFLAGIAMIFEAIQRLYDPIQIHDLQYGLILTFVSGVFNFFIGSWLKNKGNREHSNIMTASGKHLISDTLSSIGLIGGLSLVLITKQIWIDSVVAIIFGIVILITGFSLVKESLSGLLDEADQNKLAELITVLEQKRRSQWIDFHNLRMIKFGSMLHVDTHVTFPWYWSLEQSHEEVHAIEEIVKDKLGQNTEFFIHTDPCKPEKSCSICNMDCPHRKYNFEKKMSWTVENLLPNQKHGSENS